jgi:hypothetical protein
VFGGPAGTAAAMRLSKEFPDSRVDLMVTPSRLPSLLAGVDPRKVGAGLRVVAGEPLRDFSDYSRLGDRVDQQQTLWVPPKPKRAARKLATETARKISRHLKS